MIRKKLWFLWLSSNNNLWCLINMKREPGAVNEHKLARGACSLIIPRRGSYFMNRGCLLVQPDSRDITVWVILYFKGYWEIASGANPVTGVAATHKRPRNLEKIGPLSTRNCHRHPVGLWLQQQDRACRKPTPLEHPAAPHRFDTEQDCGLSPSADKQQHWPIFLRYPLRSLNSTCCSLKNYSRSTPCDSERHWTKYVLYEGFMQHITWLKETKPQISLLQ